MNLPNFFARPSYPTRMEPSMNRHLLQLGLAILLVLPASAQTGDAPAVPASEEKRTYVAADFARFAPRTALDMLNRVPGFSIRQESLQRGLGEATGNVVINGQRISGKSNDVVTELSKIPAGNVERIEIVEGETLGIPGLTGQVANVIARSTGITGQWAYRPEFRAYYTDPLFTRFEVSMSGTTGPVQYTLGLDNRGNRSGAGGPTRLYSSSGDLIEERDERWRGNSEQPRLSSRFVYDGPGTSAGNLNLSFSRFYFDYLETGTRTGTRSGDHSRRVTADEHGYSYEAGGDYELDLGPGRLKLIALARGSSYPSETTVITRFTDLSTSGFRSSRSGDAGEMISRTEYRWKRGLGEWQVSAEGAFNSLDSNSRLFTMRQEGVFEEIPLPGGTAKVEEDRYQVIGSYGRPFGAGLTMNVSLGGEYSQIAQVGAGGTTRTFWRPKGEAAAAWKVSPRTDLSVKLARRVGQLNFYDFLASVDVANDRETAANPNLVPEQRWELELEGARALGEHGRTTLRLYGRLIDDIIDYIPIGRTGQAPGNLDRATVYGIASRSTFNFDPIGWRGARLDAHLGWQGSEVEDPLTGVQRRISGSLQEFFNVSLRHDIADTDWAWGTGYSYQRNALSYRLTEVGRQWEGPVWGDLYLEHKNLKGLTVRAGVGNLLAADSMWDRTVHAGWRTDPVDFIEKRDRQIGPIFSFAIRGKF
jgi:outer membrane receptor for ferrienterochelin and colicins